MKLAIYHNLPSGGAKGALYEIVRFLVQRHDVDVYSLSTADHEFCDLRGLVNRHSIYEFRPLPLFESPLGRLNQLQRMRDIARLTRVCRRVAHDMDAGDYDLVFIHPCMWTQAPVVLQYLQTKTLYYVQEPLRLVHEPRITRPYLNTGLRALVDQFDPLIGLYRRKLRHVDRLNTCRATFLLANSHFTASNTARIYGRQAKVAYLGIDISVFRPLDNVDPEKTVLSVGAILPSKGFDFIVKSLALLPPDIRPAFRIVGNAVDAREYQYLVDLARQSGVDLRIETSISRPKLIERYNQATFLVYAPHREPFGLVPVESMSCGTPVVAVEEGGVGETVVDGVSGLLVDRNPIRFAAAIRTMLEDSQMRIDMGRRARDLVLRQWSWAEATRTIEQDLAEAVQGAETVTPARPMARHAKV